MPKYQAISARLRHNSAPQPAAATSGDAAAAPAPPFIGSRAAWRPLGMSRSESEQHCPVDELLSARPAQRQDSLQACSDESASDADESPSSPPQCPRGRCSHDKLAQQFAAAVALASPVVDSSACRRPPLPPRWLAAKAEGAAQGEEPGDGEGDSSSSLSCSSSSACSPSSRRPQGTPGGAAEEGGAPLGRTQSAGPLRGAERQRHGAGRRSRSADAARSKQVRFGDVTYHEPAPPVCSRPPNTMLLAGAEWTYEALLDALRAPPASAGATEGPGGLPRRTHRLRLTKYHNSFTGLELVQWVMGHATVASRAEAIEACQDLVTNHVVERCDHQSRIFVDGSSLYRLWDDSKHVQGHTPHEHVLNGCIPCLSPARHPTDVIDELLLALMTLYNDTHRDPYAMVQTQIFGDFVEATSELQRADLSLLADEKERTTFFVNLFNLLVLHAWVLRYGVDGQKARQLFFHKLCYDVGGEHFSLVDIESGVLGVGPKRFRQGDSRLRWAVQNPAPETCFAVQHLSADSCPVRAYNKESLTEQLADSCNDALTHAVRVADDSLTLPHTCKHLKQEMGEDRLIAFVQDHVSEAQRAAMSRCRKLRLQFAATDWHSTRPLVCDF
eukprot:TRINITY_DN65170_c0_g1_i1.p1 TRINITY_DN65170_c0_g1~~TRINITY_DN65170_c0_g1_i1.p1  ORF type:complete len:614 (+),score=148.49 TRINITY_DN65170_c0_g1_i1:116-1957(+)